MISADETANYSLFRDCLSAPLIAKFATKPSKASRKRTGRKFGTKISQALKLENDEDLDEGKDAEELTEFIDYLATEVFTSLNPELRTLTYTTYARSSTLQARYTPPLTPSTTAAILSALPASITDTLTTYLLLPSSSLSSPTPEDLLAPVLAAYLTTLTTAPPPPSQTRSLVSGCEICGRDHVPLTYHHLIPRAVHDKSVKRGWHVKEDLDRVAWLCRACHSFVHAHFAHEVLARELCTVEALSEREEVRKWVMWVRRVRWKAR